MTENSGPVSSLERVIRPSEAKLSTYARLEISALWEGKEREGERTEVASNLLNSGTNLLLRPRLARLAPNVLRQHTVTTKLLSIDSVLPAANAG